MNGWVKLSRRLLSWEWHGSPEMMSMLVHLLLCANYEPSRWRGIVVGRGQLVSSRRKLARLTGLTERQARSCLERLARTGEIVIEPSQRYSVITICRYDDYQGVGIEAVPNAVPNNDPLPSHQKAQSAAHDSDAATHCEMVDYDVVDTTMRPAHRPNEISQVGPLCDPYSKNNKEKKNIVESMARQQELARLRDDMLNTLTVEQLCMTYKVTPQQVADIVNEILTEWEIGQVEDVSRWHLTNTFRIKAEKVRNAAAHRKSKAQTRMEHMTFIHKTLKQNGNGDN